MFNFKQLCFFPLIVLLLVGCGQESAQQRLLKSSATLDQSYLPVLFYASANRQHESELAFDRFRGKWHDFYGQFHDVQLKYGVDITDELWQEDFTACNNVVASAEGLIKQKQLTKAYNELLQLQRHLPKLRHRHGLNYFPDNLSDFDEVRLAIQGQLQGKGRLTDREIAKLGELLRMAQTEWNKARTQEIDPGYFKFSPKKIKALKKLISDEDQALGTFAAALASKKIDLINAAVAGLQPDLAKITRAFGDFQPVIDRLAEERRATTTTTTTLKKSKTVKPVKRGRRR